MDVSNHGSGAIKGKADGGRRIDEIEKSGGIGKTDEELRGLIFMRDTRRGVI